MSVSRKVMTPWGRDTAGVPPDPSGSLGCHSCPRICSLPSMATRARPRRPSLSHRGSKIDASDQSPAAQRWSKLLRGVKVLLRHRPRRMSRKVALPMRSETFPTRRTTSCSSPAQPPPSRSDRRPGPGPSSPGSFALVVVEEALKFVIELIRRARTVLLDLAQRPDRGASGGRALSSSRRSPRGS